VGKPKSDIPEPVLSEPRRSNKLAQKTSLERTQATGLLVASGILIVLGVYGLAFSALYDMTLLPLVALSLVSIAAGLGILFGRKFGFWLSLLLFPLGIVEALSTLSYSVTVSGWYSNDVVALFNASVILYAVGLVISLLLVIDKRSQLK
jgi:hypothetical protein